MSVKNNSMSQEYLAIWMSLQDNSMSQEHLDIWTSVKYSRVLLGKFKDTHEALHFFFILNFDLIPEHRYMDVAHTQDDDDEEDV